MTVSADDIVKYARSWIGTPWRHQGRNRAGIDCAGLLIVTAKHFELPYEDMTGYRRDPGRAFQEKIEAHTLSHLHPIHGGIAIFSDTSQPCHTGILAVENGRITVIHSEASPQRRVHEEGFDDSHPSLKSRLIAVRLFNGVKYGL